VGRLSSLDPWGRCAHVELHSKATKVRGHHSSLNSLLFPFVCLAHAFSSIKHALFSLGLRGKVPRQITITTSIPTTQPRQIMTTSLPSPDQTLSETASQPDDQLVSAPKTATAAQSAHNSKPSDLGPGHQMAAPGCQASSEKIERAGIDARTKISNLLKDKEQEWTAVMEKKGPLRLLDLPMDVLKEIVKEVRPLIIQASSSRPF
jgi:hypothetical protein